MALTALADCELAGESKVYIFCDGPKNPEDCGEVEEVRKVVASRRWCKEVEIVPRERNLGLAESIISGVNGLIAEHGKIIVLEDDIIVSEYFLQYMNEALRYYRNNEKVMHIAAYMYPVQGNFPETFFYRLASCWGWGTWQRAWEKFEPDPTGCLRLLRERQLTVYFNHEGAIALTGMLQNQIEGKLDSWNIRWHASVIANGGLCLHPNASYVRNIGFDGSGTHCSFSDRFEVAMSGKRLPAFSRDVVESEEFYRAVREFFRAQNPGLRQRIVNGFDMTSQFDRNFLVRLAVKIRHQDFPF